MSIDQAQQRLDVKHVDLLDFLIVFAKYKRIICYWTLAFGIVAGFASLWLPNKYTSNALLMPPQQSQSTASAILAQVGALAGIAGGGSITTKNMSDIYVTMLKSRNVQDDLIAKFNLQKVYGKGTMQDTRKKLSDLSKIAVDKDGLISIDVTDRDKKRSFAIVSGYITELQRLTNTFAITNASQQRVFYERQMDIAKEQLTSAEVALKSYQEKTGLIKPEEQSKVIIEAVATLRSQIVAKEIQKSAMQKYATEQNPDLQQLEQELLVLREQLAKLEQQSKVKRDGNIFLPTSNVPDASLTYMRLLRDLKYNESLYELLAKQYEIAKLDEAKNSPIIQVLDKPQMPEKPTGPKRFLITILATVMGMILGIANAIYQNAIVNAKKIAIGKNSGSNILSYIFLKK